MPTAGQILINEALPPDLQDYTRVLDKKGLKSLLSEAAKRYPEQYPSILKKIGQLGYSIAARTGGYSLAVDLLQTPDVVKRHREQIRMRLQSIYADKRLSGKEKDAAVAEVMLNSGDALREKLSADLTQKEHPAALMVNSGAKGNKFSLSAALGHDGLYVNSAGEPMPYPVLHNYNEGLDPFEYWAGSFGARKGVVDVKLSVADSGYLSKQLAQVAHRGVVSADDADGPAEFIGLPSATDDNDNIGRLLAHPAGGYPRNTVITDRVLRDLQDKGVNDILVRSPLVGGPSDGSLYAKDVGITDKNRLPVIGENPAMTAVQALSEPITQGTLASKHSGGVAGANSAISGFKRINQILQVPKVYTGGATHAQEDGRVHSIVQDEFGGHTVRIGSTDHYVPSGTEVRVKLGDEIEAGDMISDGLPNPAEMVYHKGIGEGRRAFTDIMHKVLKETGAGTMRRNVEMLARGLVNHIRMTEETDDYAPDSIVTYGEFASHYKPRAGAMTGDPSRFANHYLERPVLHYTIGTKIRPSVLTQLKKYGVKEITASKEPPPFVPNMVRAQSVVSKDPDFLTRMYGSGQKRSIMEAARTGAKSDPFGSSFVPAVIVRSNIGKQLPGQPEPVIKSVIPHLPNIPINRPDLEPEDRNWFNEDG